MPVSEGGGQKAVENGGTAGAGTMETTMTEFERSVMSLRNTAQGMMGMPNEPAKSPGASNGPVSQPVNGSETLPNGQPSGLQLHNHLVLGLQSTLTAEWTPVEGFKLHDIVLSLMADLMTNKDPLLYVKLEATATINGLDFAVSAEIPDLTAKSLTVIIFNLALVKKAEAGSVFNAAKSIAAKDTGPKPMDLLDSSQLKDVKFAALFELVIAKPAKPGSSFQFISLDATVGAKLDYKPFKEVDVIIQNGSLRMSVVRQEAGSKKFTYDTRLYLAGQVLISGRLVAANIDFSKSEENIRTQLALFVSTGPRSIADASGSGTKGVTAVQALQKFTPKSEKSNDLEKSLTDYTSTLPEDLQYIKDGLTKPRGLEFMLQTSFLGTKIEHLSVFAALYPEDSFQAPFLRSLKIQDLQISFDSLSGEFTFSGTLQLMEILFEAELWFQKDGELRIKATVQDGVFGGFSDLARLDIFDDARSSEADSVVATDLDTYVDKHKLPSEAPLHFEEALGRQINSRASSIYFEIHAKKAPAVPVAVPSQDPSSNTPNGETKKPENQYEVMTMNWAIEAVKFYAHIGLGWEICPGVKFTDLGICFNVSDPTDNKKKQLQGVLYGRWQLKRHIMLVYIMGKETADQSTIAVGLNLGRSATSKATIAEIVADDSFGGGMEIPNVESLGSVREDISNQQLGDDTSLDGSLRAIFTKSADAGTTTKDAAPEKGQNGVKPTSRMSQLYVSAKLSSKFLLFGDHALAEAMIKMKVSEPLDKASRKFDFQLSGLLSTQTTQVRVWCTVPSLPIPAASTTNVDTKDAVPTQKNAVQLFESLRASDTDMIFTLEAGLYDETTSTQDTQASNLSGEDFLNIAGPNEKNDLQSSIPADCPAKPEQFLAGTKFKGEMIISQERGTETNASITRKLKSLVVSLELNKPWPIIDNKLVLEDLKLHLAIIYPRKDVKETFFSANGTMTLGSGTSQTKAKAVAAYENKTLTVGFVVKTPLNAIFDTFGDAGTVTLPSGLENGASEDPSKTPVILAAVHCVFRDKLLESYGIHVLSMGALPLSKSLGLENLFFDYSYSKEKDKVNKVARFGGDLVLTDSGSKKGFRAIATWEDGNLKVDFSNVVSNLTESSGNKSATRSPGQAATALYEEWSADEKPKPVTTSKDYQMASDMTVGSILGAFIPGDIITALLPEIARLTVTGGDLVIDQKPDKSWHVKNFKLQLADKTELAVGQLSLRDLSIEYKSVADPKLSVRNLDSPGPVAKPKRYQTSPSTGSPHEEEGQADGPSLFVIGTVERDKAAMRVQVSCVRTRQKSGDLTSQTTLSLRPAREGSLSVTDLFHLFSIELPSLETPSTFKGPKPVSLQIKDATGVLEKKDQNGSLSLASLQLETATTDDLVLASDPSIIARDIIALVAWSPDSGARGVICGHLILAGFDIWIIYSKTAAGFSFSGFGSPVKTDKLPGFEDVSKSLELPSTYSLPTDLKLPLKLQLLNIEVTGNFEGSFEVSAYGKEPWEVECAGSKITLQFLGVVIKSKKPEKPAEDKSTNPRTYELYIEGQLHFQSLQTTAGARLAIKPGQSKTLLASIEAAEAGENLQKIVGNGDDSASGEWAKIAPSSITTASFPKSGLLLYVDFTESKLLLAGRLEKLNTQAVFFSKKAEKDGAPRRYYFSLAVNNLELIWPALKETLLQYVHIKQCVVHIVSLGGATNTIKTDMAWMNSAITESKDTQQLGGDAVSVFNQVDPQSQVQDGAWFFAEVEFEPSSGIKDALKQLEENDSIPKITAYALLPPDGSSKTFSMALQNINLFGGAMTLESIRATYVTAGTTTDPENKGTKTGSTLTLTADLSVKGLTSSAIQFKSKVTVQDKLTSITTAALGNDKSIDEPFSGGMFNVKLLNVSASGSIATGADGKVTRSFEITGSVAFGQTASSTSTTVKPGLVGAIIFKDYKPVVAVLDYKEPVSIADIFSEVIQPGGGNDAGSWPSDFDPLSLKNTTLYYNKLEEEVAKQTSGSYSPGFNLSTDIDFGFENDITVSSKVTRQGLNICGKYNGKIDLEFMQFENLTLALDTTSTPNTYSLESTVTFFGCSGLNLKLSYNPKTSNTSSKFTGEVSYNGDIPELKDASLKISYQDKRFCIENWSLLKDLKDLQEIADLIKEIEKASSDGKPCGKIVGLVFDKAVKTKFDYHLSLPKNEGKPATGEKKPLKFRVSWEYSISVVGVHIHTTKLPEHDVVISGPFNLKELDQLLLNFVKENIANIAEALVQDPEALGNLIGAMAVENCAEQAISSILCRGSKNKRVIEQGKKLMNEKVNNAKNAKSNSGSGNNSGSGGAPGGAPGGDPGGGPGGGGSGGGGLSGAVGLLSGGSTEGSGAGLLGTLGAGAGSLMNSLLKADPDDNHITELNKEATELATKRKAELEAEVKQTITISKDPDVVWQDFGMKVVVDWTKLVSTVVTQAKSLPKSCRLLWEVAVSPSDNADDANAKKAKATDTRFEAQGDVFGTAASIFVFTRGVVDMDGKELASDFKKTNIVREVKQTPVSPSRTELSLAPAATEDSPVYQIDVSPQAIGRHRLAIWAEKGRDSTIVWSTWTQVEALNSPVKMVAPISEFDEDVWKYESIRASSAHAPEFHGEANWSLWSNSETTFPIIVGPSKLEGSAKPDLLQFQWDQPGDGTGGYKLKVSANDGKELAIKSVDAVPTHSGKRKVRAVFQEAPSVGQEVQVQISIDPHPQGAVTKSASVKLKVEEHHLLFPPEVSDPSVSNTHPDESRYLDDNKTKLDGILCFGQPVGSLAGEFFNWADTLLPKSSVWPRKIETTASVPMTALNVYKMVVSYDDNSSLERRSKTSDSDETKEVYELKAGERIVSMDVYINPPSAYVSAVGFVTNQGTTFKPDLSKAKDGIKTMKLTAPPQYALKGFWGRSGTYFDRIGPIWGRLED